MDGDDEGLLGGDRRRHVSQAPVAPQARDDESTVQQGLRAHSSAIVSAKIGRHASAEGSVFDERGRRLFCAAEARSAGYGGVTMVARATGIARSTINRGLKDLQALDPAPLEGSALRRRTPGAHADRSHAVGGLAGPAGVDDAGRSDAAARVGVQEPCEARAGVARHGASRFREPDSSMLDRLGYRRQVNRKSLEGGHHVDRNAQFEHINAQVEAFQAAGEPVISVDTKKKELDRPLQERGQRLSSERLSRQGQRARLRRQGTRQSHPLRRL